MYNGNTGDSTVDVSQLVDEKRKYVNLKSNIEKIILNINNAINSLELPASKIGSLFTIDGVSIDSGKLFGIREDLKQRKKVLEAQVLPEIRKKIKEINESIG